MADEKFDLTCGGCKRKQVIAASALIRKRACPFCGAALALPAQVEQAVQAAAKAAAPPKRTRPPIAAVCAICERVTRYTSDRIGQPAKCSLCGCPCTVPEDDGTAMTIPIAERMPKLAAGRPLAASCPSCRATRLQTAHDGVTCAACGKPATGLRLEALVQPASRDVPVLFAFLALRARWSQGQLGLAEALHLCEALDAPRRWPADVASPYGPETTLDLVQCEMLAAAYLYRWREGNTSSVFIPDMSADRGETPSKAGLVAANAVGIALLAATGEGFTASAGKQPPAGLTGVILTAGAQGRGSTLEVARRDGKGHDRAIDPATALHTLREGLPRTARRYFAFKSVFGCWTTMSMHLAATPNAVIKRLVMLDLREPARWATYLTERPAVVANAFG